MKGANMTGEKDVTRRVSLPRCPQESFVSTIFGWAPRAKIVLASRSSPRGHLVQIVHHDRDGGCIGYLVRPYSHEGAR